MQRVFEEYLSELQTDMVSICLEYVDDKADEIFIYCSFEGNTYSTGYFYKINGNMIERHKITKELPHCDDSPDMQKQVLDILMEDLKKLHRVCEKYEKPMPCEIKLIYDVKANKLNAEYKYEPVFSFDEDMLADDIEKAWFEDLKRKL